MDFHSAYLQNKETGNLIKFKVILWTDSNNAVIPILYQYTCDKCGQTVQLSGITKSVLSAQPITKLDSSLETASLDSLSLNDSIQTGTITSDRISSAFEAQEKTYTFDDLLRRRVESDRILRQFAQDEKALCDSCRSELLDSKILAPVKNTDVLVNYNETPNQDDTVKKTESPELTKSPPYGVEVTVIINKDGTIRDATTSDMLSVKTI